LNYDIKIFGIKDANIKDEIKNITNLYLLKDTPPTNIFSLRYTTEQDLPQIIKLLHSYGYYDASIKLDIDEENSIIVVNLYVTLGTRYSLASFNLIEAPCKNTKLLNDFLQDISVKINEPFLAQDIISSETKILSNLSNLGFPLAKIVNKSIVADFQKKEVAVSFCVDKGPLCTFGATTIIGLKNVKSKFITQRIPWKEGQLFSAKKLTATQGNLLNTNLFSSIFVTFADKPDETGALPIRINLFESNIFLGIKKQQKENVLKFIR